MATNRISIVAIAIWSISSICLAQTGFDPTDPETPFGGVYQYPQPVMPYGVNNGIGPGVHFSPAGASAAEHSTEKVGEFRAALHAQYDAAKAAQDAFNADPSANDTVGIKSGIAHQPLIHVKVRIVEVQRSDSLAVSSVLDFITTANGAAPFGDAPFNANSLNGAVQRTSGLTRLPVPGLLTTAGTGSGMLINLTSAHINYVASFLATELNADTISAPQVTTLNGKNVQFRSGSKIPFALGQNNITGGNNTVTEVFYKHVGTYVSVTPQIVNWGNNHGGLGNVPNHYATTTQKAAKLLFDDSEIHEPLTAIQILLRLNDQPMGSLTNALSTDVKARLKSYLPSATPDMTIVRRDIRVTLNDILASGRINRSQISDLFNGSVAPAEVARQDQCEHCTWKPSECTINLNLAVRLSDLGFTDTETNTGDVVVPQRVASEQNVRAIANEVQVKSGHGAVIGGLITMRDVERISKVPIVGDLPVVGAAFRSKQTDRVKTETLIFVEAEVLPSFDCNDQCGHPLVKAKTAQDFCNGKIHLQGELCNGALSYGMHRAGLAGDYLPRPSHGEVEYWQHYHQTLHHTRHHKITTHILDTLE